VLLWDVTVLLWDVTVLLWDVTVLLWDVTVLLWVQEVHAAAISSLAEVTARSIQHLLRAGEKILLLPEQEAQRRSSLEQSRALAQ